MIGPARRSSGSTGDRLPFDTLNDLRRMAARALLACFALQAAAVVVAAVYFSAAPVVLAMVLAIIGLLAAGAVVRAPTQLSTRYIVVAALHSPWMLGLYVAAGVNDGAHMLEVHMLYFINCLFIFGFACWRSAVFSTSAVLFHHLTLTLVAPALVWESGAPAWSHMTVHALLGILNMAGGVFGALTLGRMISNLELNSTRDDLTGLLNRRGVWREIEDQLAQNGDVFVLQCDLDGFKRINDTAGHGVGDAVLVKVAESLISLAPPDATVGRLGGDEFVVSLALDADRAGAFAEDFLEWTRKPVAVGAINCRFGVSIGISSTRDSDRTVEALMVDADTSLYAAKKAGKNRVETYSSEMGIRAKALQTLTDDILRAVENDEFEPFFQTQHDAGSGRIVGVEALSRWRHPARGVLPPSEFIELADEMGRLSDIDERILDKSVEGLLELEDQGLALEKLSVNVSYSRLREPGLFEGARNASRLNATLAFEIVEAVFLDGIEEVDRWTLDRLRDQGVALEIDDFGTGHASIVALTRLSPDRLKIARELISPIAENPSRARMLEAIVELARALDIDTIAEGVETAEQAEMLRKLGVPVLQGYLFSRPMSLNDLRGALIEDQKVRHMSP